MRPIETSFFAGKRPWSRIKDRVLGSYLPPYLQKVQRLRRAIVIVDCFAGQGAFDDDTIGSPLIICRQIERHAPLAATAYFVNKRPEHHEALTNNLSAFVEKRIAYPVLGQGDQFLTDLAGHLQDQSLFVYLDPFGLKGCHFEATERLLQRGSGASTEILMTLSAPVLHRLAARSGSHQIVSRFHALLDAVLGDVPWRKIMYDKTLPPSEKERQVIEGYCDQLRRHTRYACACPVRDRDNTRVKYYIVFASRHLDGVLLMNDIMLDAYHDHTAAQAQDTLPLFAALLEDWKTDRGAEVISLSRLIADMLRQSGTLKRSEVWRRIVPENFMQYRESEFREAVRTLVDDGTVAAVQPSGGTRLGDQSLLSYRGARNRVIRQARAV